jgi:D-lactate dehydrogenase (cytochrome)
VLSALSKESFGLLTEPSDIEKYSIDWLGQFGSPALAVIRPSSTEAVAEAVRHCGEHGVPIVPQGGNTGLVSGGVPRRPSEEVVLSLERMASIQSFDEDSGIVVAEAGCTLGSLDAWLRENHGRCMPLDLGSKGSCMLGGNLATAAGGISMVRYGSLHASLVGMRVVLASGQVVDGLRTAQKSNVGYHWPHLFVGSEGTLGIITAAAIKTPPAPAHTATAMLAFEKWDQLRACVRRAMGAHGLAETLGALEYVDAATVDLGTAWNPQAKRFDEDDWPYALLVEAAGSSQSHCESRLEAVLQGGIAAGDIGFGVVAASDRQREAMWRLREGATGALNHRGPGLKFDVSLPLRLMAGPDGLVAAARTRLESVVGRSMMSAGKVVGGGWGYEGSDEGGIVVCGYGHVGDGNLHLNVSIPSAAAASGDAWKTHASGDTMHCVHSSCSAPLSDVVSQAKDAMLPWLAEWVAERGGAGGSVSAEHGVGLSKLDYAGLSRGTGEEELMRQIKQAMDPRHLLNPGRVLNSD